MVHAPGQIPILGTRKPHAYAASFGDDLAASLIVTNSAKGDTVLDPFFGAATTLVQARILGRRAVGIDVDPIACLIGRVLTERYSRSTLRRLHRSVLARLEQAAAELSALAITDETMAPGAQFNVNGHVARIPDRREIAFWFLPLQRALLGALTALRSQYTPRLCLILDLVISGSIIRKWPNTISMARDIDHSRPHKTFPANPSLDFHLGVFRRSLGSVLRTMNGLVDLVEPGTPKADVYKGDAADVLARLKADSIDYVLTSPPYFNAIDYPRAHKFSEWWLWPDRPPVTASHYIGLRKGSAADWEHLASSMLSPATKRQLTSLRDMPSVYGSVMRYVAEMSTVIRGMARVLKPGRCITMVVANNIIAGHEVPVSSMVGDMMQAAGFTLPCLETRAIRVTRRRYPFGHGFVGPMKEETVVHSTKKPSF